MFSYVAVVVIFNAIAFLVHATLLIYEFRLDHALFALMHLLLALVFIERFKSLKN